MPNSVGSAIKVNSDHVVINNACSLISYLYVALSHICCFCYLDVCMSMSISYKQDNAYVHAGVCKILYMSETVKWRICMHICSCHACFSQLFVCASGYGYIYISAFTETWCNWLCSSKLLIQSLLGFPPSYQQWMLDLLGKL